MFGEKYRIKKDSAISNRRKVDPMYYIIPCKYGEIFPYGGDFLAAMVTSIRIANEVRSWSELEVTQDADDAVIFKFHVKHFEKVADRIMARKKKRLSKEHREKLATSNMKFRFKPASDSSKSGQDSTISDMLV